MPLAAQRDAEETRRRRLAEAELIAAEIEALLRQGRPVWDKRAAGYREVCPGDIAILLRRFKNVHLFEQALEAHRLPYATPSGTGFFTRQEVLDLENLLRWLAQPDDDIALVAILRSPLFMLADDVLFRLRATGQPLLWALAAPPDGFEEDDRGRCIFAATVLRNLRAAARTSAPVDLLEAALDATAFEASWAPLTGGEQALANIRKLVRIVRTLAGFSLSEVAAYLEQRRDDLDAREGPAVLDRPDAVQLMTIHGAKGLEFPVIFVPEAHVAVRDMTPAVLWRPSEGISFTLERGEDDDRRPQPGFYRHLQRLNGADERDEHLRLFYVASTRAGDYLYLSGDDSGNDGWLAAVNAAQDAGVLDHIEARPAAVSAAGEVARRSVPSAVSLPTAARPYTPPLLTRPAVIPLRASTPVTALRFGETHYGGHGDGLGLVRGRIAHRAIEARYGADPAFSLETLETIARQAAGEVGGEALTDLLAEVNAMLDRFLASDIGRALGDPSAQPQFEVPFAWDWDGIPVHGQIDLLYRDGPRWRVVDYKTDRISAGKAREAARPYLVQIGLYASALEAATGVRPAAGLFFLRDGHWYEPPRADIEAAMTEVRARIDAGLVLDPDLPEYLGFKED